MESPALSSSPTQSFSSSSSFESLEDYTSCMFNFHQQLWEAAKLGAQKKTELKDEPQKTLKIFGVSSLTIA
ncbi:hypothetical protein [Phaffia rhodozyma]|uniref:Uncharacterized protein n=1 Tax=Phaffia rhodozyma TaxID=264483 RepID=A0A0F7SJ97_PHARH|nr:hypothetical protein [Phaffia rhodozyma]